MSIVKLGKKSTIFKNFISCSNKRILNGSVNRCFLTSKPTTQEKDLRVRPQFHPVDAQNPYLKHPITISVIGAPMTYGQPILGTDNGPDMLRQAGLHDTLIDLSFSVEENGNLSFDLPHPNDPKIDTNIGRAKHSFAIGKAIKKVCDIVKKKIEQEKFSLVLGGDHSIGTGSLAGCLAVRPDTGFIWVDAHADINTPSTSLSGNMHGMPLSFLIKEISQGQHTPGFEWLNDGPFFDPTKQLVYIGLRDVDAGEVKLIKQLGICAFTMQDVDRYGIGKTMEMALDHLLKEKQRPLHMSYDIDAVDPIVAPSTGTKVRGGLSWREAHFVAEAVAETNLLGSLDMVEVNPSLSPGEGSQATIEMALLLIASALGNRII